MIKRYEPELNDYCGDMDCCPPYVTMEIHDNGDYVTWEDYCASLDEIKALEEHNLKIREWNRKIYSDLRKARDIVSRYQYPDTTGS